MVRVVVTHSAGEMSVFKQPVLEAELMKIKQYQFCQRQNGTVGFTTSECCLSEIRGVPLKDGKAKSGGLYLLRSVLSDLCTQCIVSC